MPWTLALVKKHLEKAKLQAIEADILAAVKPAIALLLADEDADCPLGCSRFGGRPDWPAGSWIFLVREDDLAAGRLDQTYNVVESA